MSAKCKPGGRFVENVDRAPGRFLRQLGRELDPLRFAAGKRVAGLPEPQIAEPDVLERAQLVGHRRDIAEEARRFVDRHLEHVGDVFALVGDLERLAIVALALADLADRVGIGEEVHLDLDHPVALAIFAAAALHVEAETPRAVAANPRGRQLAEEIANRREGAGVSDRIRARGAADRALVDDDRLVDLLEAVEAAMFARLVFGVVKMAEERAPQDVVDQRGFAAAGDAGDAGEAA